MRPFPEDDDALALDEEDAVADPFEGQPNLLEPGVLEELADLTMKVNDDGVLEVPEVPTRSPITGGEGHGSADARQLVVIIELTKRPELDTDARIWLLESDIREAMAKAARRLNETAMKYSVQGFTWDLDDIVYEHGAARTITATLRIARNGA